MNIGLGLSVAKICNSALNFAAVVINTFKARVLADSGTFEAESCLQTTVTSLNSQGFYDKASLILTSNADKVSKMYSLKPIDGSGDFSFSRSSSAIRNNTSGLLQLMSSNIPRLNYPSTGSCPLWLIESQKTNLVLRSQEFGVSPWTGSGVTVTDNTTTAPDGTLTADTLNITGASGFRRQFVSIAASTTYTVSCYVRNVSITAGQTFRMYVNNNVVSPNSLEVSAVINIVAGTVSTPTIVGATSVSASMEVLPNSWYRVSLTFTSNAGTTSASSEVGFDSPSAGREFSAWGYQLEISSFASSYIPTTSSTATRLVDAPIKTGISSLIGQTQGTFFFDINLRNILGTRSLFNSYVNGSTSNRMQAFYGSGSNLFVFNILVGGVAQYGPITVSTGFTGRMKVAFAYNTGTNGCAVYANGSLINQGTAAAIPACDSIVLGGSSVVTAPFDDTIRDFIAFDTRLTNTELATLTTL